jgi:hypothetical protein
VLPDYDNVLHHYPMTIGEYALGTDHRGRVDALAREFQMTVGQLVSQFGQGSVSTTIKSMYDRNQLDAWVPVIHMIEPNAGRDHTKRDNLNMAYRSSYLEMGGNEDKFLRQSGFKKFPALCPRWALTGNDIYGSSPGMEAQGDVKQLQHEQLRKSQAIDYQVNPPLMVPTQYKDAARNRLPGGIMYADVTQAGGGIRSAFEVNINMQHLLEDINDVRQRVRSAYYADLFMMLATEVAERHEEKMLMIGPVLERLHDELLKPLIDIAFDYATEAGILPEPPKELQGMELNTEFISTLAQAQRIVSAQGMDRLLATVGNLAGLKPEVIDKIDFDQAIDDYAQMYGVNPEIVVPDDVVAQKRAADAKQAQAMQAAATMPQAVESAKTASEIDPANLQSVMAGLQGYNTPGAQ